MMGKLRWAIWGTGLISGVFAGAFRYIGNGDLAAVLSRNKDTAKAFAQKHGAPRAYWNAVDMLADKEIDIVYIGTPIALHAEQALQCFRAGKHVLCEKPIAAGYAEAAAMTDAARHASVFFMEAVWSRFMPVIAQVGQWIREGRIGRPLRTKMNFSVCTLPDDWRRWPQLKGGALIDVGIYCLTVISMAFGFDPTAITGYSLMENGVDIADSVILRYEDSQLASFTCGLDSMCDYRFHIYGEDAYIEVDDIYHPTKAELYGYEKHTNTNHPLRDVFEEQYEEPGLQFEAVHAGDCILRGKTESDIVPHSTSLKTMRLIDDIKNELGMRTL